MIVHVEMVGVGDAPPDESFFLQENNTLEIVNTVTNSLIVDSLIKKLFRVKRVLIVKYNKVASYITPLMQK